MTNAAMNEIVFAAEQEGLFSPRATASYGVTSTRAWVRGHCPRLGRTTLLEVRPYAFLSMRRRQWRDPSDPVGVMRYRAAALVAQLLLTDERARYGDSYSHALFSHELTRTRTADLRLTDLIVDAFGEAVDCFRDYHQQLEMAR